MMFQDWLFQRWRWGYVPACLFLLVGGAMNLKYAATLGTGDEERLVYQAAAIAITGYSVAGWDYTLKHYRSGDYLRALAAFVFLAGCLAYDGSAAYGFNVREQKITQTRTADAKRKHDTAKADLTKAESELATYNSAPALEVVKQRVKALEEALPKSTCRQRRLHEDTRKQCEALTAARDQEAAAEARERLQADVERYRKELDKYPEPPPDDARKGVLGEFGAKWLPVLVIMGGATLSFFVIPPRPPKPTPAYRSGQVQSSPPPQSHPPSVPALPRSAGDIDPTEVIQMLEALETQPANQLPVKVRVFRIEHDVAVRGPQRGLANAIDVPLSTLHRALKAGKKHGWLEVDTKGGATVVRIISRTPEMAD